MLKDILNVKHGRHIVFPLLRIMIMPACYINHFRHTRGACACNCRVFSCIHNISLNGTLFNFGSVDL